MEGIRKKGEYFFQSDFVMKTNIRIQIGFLNPNFQTPNLNFFPHSGHRNIKQVSVFCNSSSGNWISFFF